MENKDYYFLENKKKIEHINKEADDVFSWQGVLTVMIVIGLFGYMSQMQIPVLFLVVGIFIAMFSAMFVNKWFVNKYPQLVDTINPETWKIKTEVKDWVKSGFKELDK